MDTTTIYLITNNSNSESHYSRKKRQLLSKKVAVCSLISKYGYCATLLAKTFIVTMHEDDIHLDHQLMKRIKAGESLAYDVLFKKYYAYLCMIVYRMTQDKSRAEDVVQDVMLELWRKRESIEIKNAVKSYLHRSVRNKTLNLIRDEKMKFEGDEQLLEVPSGDSSVVQMMQGEDLAETLQKTYEKLPEKCRIVFALVKYEGLSYKETAQQLDISVKTVENQISKALRIFRKALKK